MLGRTVMPAVGYLSSAHRARISLPLTRGVVLCPRSQDVRSPPAFATLSTRPGLACCGVAFAADERPTNVGTRGWTASRSPRRAHPWLYNAARVFLRCL